MGVEMDEPHIVSDNQNSVLSQLDSDVYNALLDSVKEKEKQSEKYGFGSPRKAAVSAESCWSRTDRGRG